MNQERIIETAHALADVAREAILPFFRGEALETQNKRQGEGAFDPVTRADRAAETAMRDMLALRHPDDGILGEEFGLRQGRSGLTWVIDPIDGTRAFMSGAPTWGVLIALVDASGPVYGLIEQPYIGERFEGGFGRAIMHGPLGPRPLQARSDRALDAATLFTTFPEIGTEAEKAAFDLVAREVQLTRYGMDCYAYAMLAAGQIDLVIEAGLSAYDIAAPIAVIEAAGGIVTDWQGAPVHDGGRVLAAASRQQHDAALTILSSVT